MEPCNLAMSCHAWPVALGWGIRGMAGCGLVRIRWLPQVRVLAQVRPPHELVDDTGEHNRRGRPRPLQAMSPVAVSVRAQKVPDQAPEDEAASA